MPQQDKQIKFDELKRVQDSDRPGIWTGKLEVAERLAEEPLEEPLET